jgi:hypothetical protein
MPVRQMPDLPKRKCHALLQQSGCVNAGRQSRTAHAKTLLTHCSTRIETCMPLVILCGAPLASCSSLHLCLNPMKTSSFGLCFLPPICVVRSSSETCLAQNPGRPGTAQLVVTLTSGQDRGARSLTTCNLQGYSTPHSAVCSAGSSGQHAPVSLTPVLAATGGSLCERGWTDLFEDCLEMRDRGLFEKL